MPSVRPHPRAPACLPMNEITEAIVNDDVAKLKTLLADDKELISHGRQGAHRLSVCSQ